MIIFEKNNIIYVYIHIPKNSGKYIRDLIKKKNKVIKNLWDIQYNYDLAHLPYCLRKNYINNDSNYNYFTFVRNPYYRIISAYFYKNKKSNIDEFKSFIINTLQYLLFNTYYCEYIHYYPQYKFLVNNYNDENINSNIKFFKIENYNDSYLDINNLVEKKYDLNKYLDNETIEVLNEIYSKDFTIFDYPKIVFNTNLCLETPNLYYDYNYPHN